MNLIQYGLSQLMYVPVLGYDITAKKYTYGKVKPIPGAKKINLPPSGGTTVIYADNIKYYVIESNQGYNGTVDVVLIPASFIEDIFRETKVNGVRYENSAANTVEFALMGQFEGNEYPKRFCLPRCKATRKTITGETKQESITEQNDSISIEVMPRENDFDTKYSVERADDPAKYSKWFEGVHERPMVDYISFDDTPCDFKSIGDADFTTEYKDLISKATGTEKMSIVPLNGNIKVTVKVGNEEVQEGDDGKYSITVSDSAATDVIVEAVNLLGDKTVYTFSITGTAA